MYKIKKSYTVLGDKVKVKFVDTLEFAGMYDSSKHIIYISTNQSKEEQVKTFWHEMTHCIQFQMGLNQAVSHELLEIMAETFSKVLFKLVKL